MKFSVRQVNGGVALRYMLCRYGRFFACALLVSIAASLWTVRCSLRETGKCIASLRERGSGGHADSSSISICHEAEAPDFSFLSQPEVQVVEKTDMSRYRLLGVIEDDGFTGVVEDALTGICLYIVPGSVLPCGSVVEEVNTTQVTIVTPGGKHGSISD